MRYLVKAKLRPGKDQPLLHAIRSEKLGEGSVAYGEYVDNMRQARLTADGVAVWVETCFCAVPLEEERPYWEEFFELVKIKDAHNRKNCRDANGSEPWACAHCDCTKRLEQKLAATGVSFLEQLHRTAELSGSSSSTSSADDGREAMDDLEPIQAG